MTRPPPRSPLFPYPPLFRSGLRADDRPRQHARVIAETYLAADDRVRLDDGAPRYAGLRRDDHALADLHVVPDLDEVIYLRPAPDRKSTRLNSSHLVISYAVF